VEALEQRDLMSVTQPLAMYGNWNYLGETVRAVSTAFDANNNLYAFGIGTSDNAVYYSSQSPNGTWSGWNSLGGAALSITAIRDVNGTLDVFAIGTDHALYCNSYSQGTTHTAPSANLSLYPPPGTTSPWSGWKSLGGYVQSITAALDAHHQLDVFGVGSNDAVYYVTQSLANGSWSAWNDLYGTVKPASGDFDPHGNLQAALDSHGNLDVFAIGGNNAVWYNSRSAVTGTWGGWNSLGGAVLSLSASLDAGGNLDVFTVGTNLGVWYRSQSAATGTWSTWNSLSGQGEEWLSVNAALDPRGNLDVYAIGTDGSVQYQEQPPKGGWSGGWMLTDAPWSPPVKSLCLTVNNVRGEVDVLGIGSANNTAYVLQGASYYAPPASDTLFGPNGPSYKDVQQGFLNDCWLLAGLAEVAARAPSDIKSMFTYDGTTVDNGSVVGLYTVRFYNPSGVAEYVQVDTELPGNGMGDQPVNNVLWVALAEKAYVEANAAGFVTSGHVGVDDYSALNFGYSSWALQAITGRQASGGNTINATSIALDWVEGQFMLFNTTTPSSSAIVKDHVYALVGYDPSSSNPYQLFNPWGATATGGTPESSSIFGLFSTNITFLSQNFHDMSATSGAAPMAPGRVMTKLALATGAVSPADPSDALFSAAGGPSKADATFWAVGGPSDPNRPRYDRAADALAPPAAGPAARAVADVAASFAAVHKRATASDALFADFGSV
jgi:hypothetical protein